MAISQRISRSAEGVTHRARRDPRQQGARRPHDPRHRRRRVRRRGDLGGGPRHQRQRREGSREHRPDDVLRLALPDQLRGVRRHRRDLQVAAAIRRSRSPTSTRSQRLPTVRTAGARLDTQRDGRVQGPRPARRRASTPSPATGSRSTAAATSIPGRNFTHERGRRPASASSSSTTSWRSRLFGESDPLDKMIDIGDVPFKVSASTTTRRASSRAATSRARSCRSSRRAST